MPARNSRNIAAKAAAETASAVVARIRSKRVGIDRAANCAAASGALSSFGARGLLQQVLVPGLGEVGAGVDPFGVVVERLHFDRRDGQALGLETLGDLLLVAQPCLCV